MKHSVIPVALSLLLSTTALAEETQRHLIATPTPLRVAPQSEAAVVLRDIEPRRGGTFTTFRGFAADLTPTEVAVSLSEIFSSVETEDGAPAGSIELVVARIGANGKPELACVGSEQAAREFLEGRGARRSREPVDY